MPNPLSGILGGFGNLLGNMAAGGNPASQQLQWQQQGYGDLSQQMGPGDAALAMSKPELFEGLWKMRIYQQQYKALKAAGLPDDKISAVMGGFTGPAAESQYGPPKQFQGAKYPGGYEPPLRYGKIVR